MYLFLLLFIIAKFSSSIWFSLGGDDKFPDARQYFFFVAKIMHKKVHKRNFPRKNEMHLNLWNTQGILTLEKGYENVWKKTF